MSQARKRGNQPEHNRSTDDRVVDERLIEIIKANTFRAGTDEIEPRRLPKRGIFAQSFAILGLIGLMIVSFFYTRLTGTES